MRQTFNFFGLMKCITVDAFHRGIQSEDKNELNTVKVRTFLQSEDKICMKFAKYYCKLWNIIAKIILQWYVLCLWGIEECKPYPRFVLHVLSFVLTLNVLMLKLSSFDTLVYTFSHTIYTCAITLNAGKHRSVLGRVIQITYFTYGNFSKTLSLSGRRCWPVFCSDAWYCFIPFKSSSNSKLSKMTATNMLSTIWSKAHHIISTKKSHSWISNEIAQNTHMQIVAEGWDDKTPYLKFWWKLLFIFCC